MENSRRKMKNRNSKKSIKELLTEKWEENEEPERR